MTEELKPCPAGHAVSAEQRPEPVAWMRLQDYLAFYESGHTESAVVLNNQWGTTECVPLYTRAESAEVLDECWALIGYDKDGKTFATCIGETAQEVWTQSYMDQGWPGFAAMRVKIVRAE